MRTVATALATHLTDEGTFDASLAELVRIEPALGEASPQLAVRGDEEGYTITERSASGIAFTLVREPSGETRRTCSQPGRGLCRDRADAAGNRW